jgi:hypothetical protein
LRIKGEVNFPPSLGVFTLSSNYTTDRRIAVSPPIF